MASVAKPSIDMMTARLRARATAMDSPTFARKVLLALFIVALHSPSPSSSKEFQMPRRLQEDAVYAGWLGSKLAKGTIVSERGHELGQVRRITIAANGQIWAFTAEQPGLGIPPDFVFHLPWKNVSRLLRPGVVVARFETASRRGLDAMRRKPIEDRVATTFRLADIIGDNVRLKTGLLYGTVTDTVFSTGGKLVAVLVTREGKDDGAIAFPFPGQLLRWSPTASYYGLPFITLDQADSAGLEIDWHKFKG